MDLVQIINNFINVMDSVVLVASSVAVLVFVWGVVQMIFGMGNYSANPEEARTKGKKRIVWGLLGLFFIFSLWGIIYLMIEVFGIQLPGGNTQDPIEIII